MTNGFNGTGISILYYLVLALLMPFVQLYRLARRRHLFKPRFVFRHFLYGVMIALMVAMGISYLSTYTGIREHGQWRDVIGIGAWSASILVVLWTIIPLLIKLMHSILKDGPFVPNVTQINAPADRRKYQVIDSIMSNKQWQIFSQRLYGSEESFSLLEQLPAKTQTPETFQDRQRQSKAVKPAALPSQLVLTR